MTPRFGDIYRRTEVSPPMTVMIIGGSGIGGFLTLVLTPGRILKPGTLYRLALDQNTEGWERLS